MSFGKKALVAGGALLAAVGLAVALQRKPAVRSPKAELLEMINACTPYVNVVQSCAAMPEELPREPRDNAFLQEGLVAIRGAQNRERTQAAVTLYQQNNFRLTMEQARALHSTIEHDFLAPPLVYPLLAILGEAQITDATRAQEEEMVTYLEDVVTNPTQYPNVKLQAINFLSWRARKYALAREPAESTLREIVINAAITADMRSEAALGLLDARLGREEEPLDIIETGVTRTPTMTECRLARQTRRLVYHVAEYIAGHSTISREVLRASLRDDFLVEWQAPPQNRGEGEEGMYYATGRFDDKNSGKVAVIKIKDAHKVGAHEVLHALAYHLRMRQVERDTRRFGEVYRDQHGYPALIEELVTESFLNRVIAQLIDVPAEILAELNGGYEGMLRREPFQRIYRRVEELAGRSGGLARAYLLSGKGVKDTLYQDAIRELYGDDGVSLLMDMGTHESRFEEVALQLQALQR